MTLEQLAAFIHSVLRYIHATGVVGMEDEFDEALLAFRAWNYERIYLRPAARQQMERAIRLLQGLVEYYIDAPGRLPDVHDAHVAPPASGSKEAAVLAVTYVGGMTDRFALGKGVELLGWRPEDLPKGA